MSTDTQTAAPSSVLRVQVERVHEARRNVEAIAGALKAKREAFEADNAELIGMVKGAQNTLLEEELRLRDMAVAEFRSTGSTRPGPGLQIKLKTAIRYDEGEAFAWARATGMALTLDKKAFDTIAEVSALPFVTVTKEPTATIATDLAKALGGAS